jgi:hypothetical protein
MTEQKKFHWKAFVSFYVVFSFLVIAVSGIVLYIAPPGRIANWSIWRFVALSKAQWQATHTVFAFLFVLAAGFHIYFNWKVLLSYLKSKLREGLRMKWELGSASLAGAAILVLTLSGTPPFSTVMDVGEDLKNSWSTTTSEPPIPHAELMSIARLSETVKVPIEKILANLEKHGLKVESADVTIKEIADRHGLTPQQVYQKVQSDDVKPPASLVEGGGWGQKNVADVCTQFGVSIETGLQRLHSNGIEAKGDTPIRDLATAHQKTPIEIAKIIVG